MHQLEIDDRSQRVAVSLAVMVAPMAKKAQPKGVKKIKQQTFVIDCSKPVEDKIMEIASLQKFLTDRIKVNGKTGDSNHSLIQSYADGRRKFAVRLGKHLTLG